MNERFQKLFLMAIGFLGVFLYQLMLAATRKNAALPYDVAREEEERSSQGRTSENAATHPSSLQGRLRADRVSAL